MNIQFNETDLFEQLVQEIAPQSRLLRTWSLKGGISAEMIALEIERPDGRTSRMIVRRPGAAALRQNPRAAEDEFKLLNIVQSLGIAAQTPYYLDQSGKIFSTPCLVIEYVEGKPEFAPAHVNDFILQFATQLARIHSADCSKQDLSFLPEQTKGFANTSGGQLANIDASFDENRVRETLEAAAALPLRNASVLLHGDFWPGNVLWRDGKLVAVIDWEDAKLGDPLSDFAISRFDVLCIFGIDAMNSFTQHYTSMMAIDYTQLPYWDLYAALRIARLAGPDLAGWATFFVPFGRPDITEHTLREHFRYFIAQAFDRLEGRTAG